MCIYMYVLRYKTYAWTPACMFVDESAAMGAAYYYTYMCELK